MLLNKKMDDLAVYLIAPKIKHREKMLLDLKNSFNKLVLVTCSGSESDNNLIAINSHPNPTGILRLLGLLKIKKMIDKYLYFPSPLILCVNAAKKTLETQIKEDIESGLRISIITSTPPHDMTLLGLHLKNKFPSIRWIVDWQDLWSFDEAYLNRIPKVYKNRLLNLEQHILQSSDLNITTNFKAADILEKQYNVNKNKLRDIMHPYNPDEYREFFSNKITPLIYKNNDTIKIGFLGTLSKPPKVPGAQILEAIDKILDKNINVELHIYGDPSEFTKNDVANMKNNFVTLHPITEHITSLRNISKCDFLLLTLADLPNCNVIMHAKLPHYLILNRPILAFVPQDSFAASVIKKTGTGIVIPNSSNWSVELEKILSQYIRGELKFERNETAINEYSWNTISNQWLTAIANN